MFPPPQPWKVLQAPDPNRSYLAFSSRFAMRSVFTVPGFIKQSNVIQKQVANAPGAIGFSLAANLPSLEFYTLSAWEDEAQLYRFTRELAHGDGMRMFHRAMRSPSLFTKWQVLGKDLPLAWSEAVHRLNTAPHEAHPATG